MSISNPANRDTLGVGTGDSPTFTGLTLSGLTLGSAPFAGASGVISQDNANLFWDDTLNRLGIGEDTPLAKLHIEEAGTDDLLRVRQALSTKLIVRNNGNVGIGTSAPDKIFHVAKAVNGGTALALFENSQANAASSVNETAEIRFGFGGDNDVARIIVGKEGDYTSAALSDSFMAFYTDLDGAAAEKMRIASDGNFGIGVVPTSILSFKMGTGTGQAQASGKANVNTTAVGTDANTAEKDLITYSLPANSFSADGRGVKITAWGSVATNGNTKTIRLKFGATIIRQIGPSGMNGLDWRIDGLVIRTGATTQDAMATEFLDVSAQDTTISTPAETLSGAVVIKITGQNGTASANDILAKGILIEYLN